MLLLTISIEDLRKLELAAQFQATNSSTVSFRLAVVTILQQHLNATDTYAGMKPTLQSLPEELILRIISHVHRLDDLYSLMLTTKLLHRISNDASPDDISRMALNTANYLPGLQPYQHMLLVPTARRLADWAVQTGQRRKKLASSMLGGIDGLVALALEEAPITLDEIRAVWRWKQDILNPISAEVDGACGRPTEPDGFMTVCENPSLMLLIWVIYGELFHHSVSYLYLHQNGQYPTPLDCITRFKFLVYCMPDVNSFSYMGLGEPDWFKPMAKSAVGFQQLSLNYAMREFVFPSLWGRAIRELDHNLLSDDIGDGDDDWHFEYLTKDRLFLTSVAGSGMRALDVLQASRSKTQHSLQPAEELVRWLRTLHNTIQGLPETETESGDISAGSPYDPWIQETWVMMPWDQRQTMWDQQNYTLRAKVVDEDGDEGGWEALKRAVGEDPLADKTSWSQLMDDIEE